MGINLNERRISLIEPRDVLGKIASWVRAERIRANLTQPELAIKSGVPKTTISRFERTGLASTDTALRILFALDRLDAVDAFLEERMRLAKFPKSLIADGDNPGVHRNLYRVRHRRAKASLRKADAEMVIDTVRQAVKDF